MNSTFTLAFYLEQFSNCAKVSGAQTESEDLSGQRKQALETGATEVVEICCAGC